MITSANSEQVALVRYGAIPEVAKFRVPAALSAERSCQVVVETHRGLQLGDCLQVMHDSSTEIATNVVRIATQDDCSSAGKLKDQCAREFDEWIQRISDWKIAVELVDLEYTLDGSKLILYVLNERGPECTRLAIQAAAAGLGIIEVQPVNREGLVQLPPSGGGGGCGSDGGGCGCSH